MCLLHILSALHGCWFHVLRWLGSPSPSLALTRSPHMNYSLSKKKWNTKCILFKCGGFFVTVAITLNDTWLMLCQHHFGCCVEVEGGGSKSRSRATRAEATAEVLMGLGAGRDYLGGTRVVESGDTKYILEEFFPKPARCAIRLDGGCDRREKSKVQGFQLELTENTEMPFSEVGTGMFEICPCLQSSHSAICPEQPPSCGP